MPSRLLPSQTTPFLRLRYTGQADLNDNFAKLDEVIGSGSAGLPAPPVGAAGGDLSGNYPSPTIRDLAVTDPKIVSVAWGKITGAPTNWAPSGPASGDLTGTYPAPQIAPAAVTEAELAAGAVTAPKLATGAVSAGALQDGAVETAKLAAGAVTRATTAPDCWLSPIPSGADAGKVLTVAAGPTLAWQTGAGGGAPSGPAGGDLAGTYPDPTIGAAKVTRAKTATDCWLSPVPSGADVGKYLAVTAGPTLSWQTVGTGGPPSGPAGGDLAGTYPDPTIGAGKVTNAALAATGLDASKLTIGTLPVAQVPNLDAAKVTTGTFALARIPTMDAAHIPDLDAAKITTGTFALARIPTMDQAHIPVAPSGLLTTNLNDSQVTDAKIADLAATKLTGIIAQARLPTAPSGLLTANLNDAQVTRVKTATDLWLSPVPVGGDVGKVLTVAAGPALAWQAAAGGAPSGTASGDLGGTYPGPTVARINGAVLGATTPLTRGDILVANSTPQLVRLARGTAGQVLTISGSDAVWAAPAGGAPTGTAGGDLGGTYPNPVVDGINGAAVGTTTPLTRGDILVANSTPALVRLARGTSGQVLTISGQDAVWAAPAGGSPTGAAGGDLTGTYPNPTIGAGKVTAAQLATDAKPWTTSGTQTLVPVDTARTAIQLGSGTIKARLYAHTNARTRLTQNLQPDATTLDDGAQPAWMFDLGGTADLSAFYRRANSGASVDTLLTLDNAGRLAVPGTDGSDLITVGKETVKARISCWNGDLWISTNYRNAPAAPDDLARPSWWFGMYNDAASIERNPPGGGAGSKYLEINSAGRAQYGAFAATKWDTAGTVYAPGSDQEVVLRTVVLNSGMTANTTDNWISTPNLGGGSIFWLANFNAILDSNGGSGVALKLQYHDGTNWVYLALWNSTTSVYVSISAVVPLPAAGRSLRVLIDNASGANRSFWFMYPTFTVAYLGRG
jgi:hypothetical protein